MKQYKLIWRLHQQGRKRTLNLESTNAPKTFELFGLYSTFDWDVAFPNIPRDDDRHHYHGFLDEVCYGYHFADPRKGGIVEIGRQLMAELSEVHPGARLYIDYDRSNIPILVVGT